MKALFIILLMFSFPLMAGEFTLVCDPPTTRTDGSALPLSDIDHWHLSLMPDSAHAYILMKYQDGISELAWVLHSK